MGGEAKETLMVLKVDLGCKKCYRKIKKVLCSTPQIRDQIFDEKLNIVAITVICCTPEKVADKIRRTAGGTIKGIDVKPSQPPAKPPGDKGPPPSSADKPKQGPPPPATAEKTKSAPPQSEKPKGEGGEKPKPQPQPQAGGNPDKPKKVDFAPMGGGPPRQQQQQFQPGPPPQSAPKPNQPAAFMSPEPIPVAGYPSIFPPVVYYDGGPYYQNQGMSAMAAPQRFPHNQPIYQYDGYTGRPVTDSYGGGRPYRADYFTEENPSSCSVM